VELAARSASVVAPEMLEVVVIESAASLDGLPFTVAWGADTPMEDLVESPVEAYVSRDPADIGTFLEASQAPWFTAMADEYRQAVPAGSPSAIGIRTGDAAESVSHLLYVRPVVP